MQKSLKLSNLLKPIIFIVFSLCFEMVNFLFIRFKVTGNSSMAQLFPTYIMIDIAFIMLIAGFMFVSKKWVQNLIMYFVIGLQVVVNIVNSTLYKVFGDIFSFDMMKLGKEAVAAFKLEFIEGWSILVNLSLLAILIVVQVIMDRKIKKQIELKKGSRLAILLGTFMICFTFSMASFFGQIYNFKESSPQTVVAESDQYLWENMQFKLEAYKKFGTFGFYYKSLGNVIYKNDHMTENDKDQIIENLKQGEKEKNIFAPLYGDNLIVIMLESFEWFAIDPFNTPTLWEIRTSTGTTFENFYSKNKTNMSEDIAILGNMPKDTQMTKLAKEGNLANPYSLPNLFKEQGYASNFFHTYQSTFYDRNKVNKAMGFENVYGIEHSTVENKSLEFYDWNLDSEFVKNMSDKFILEDKPFFSFLTTVATHGTYKRTNERFINYYNEYDNNLEEYKSWLAQETAYNFPETEEMQKVFRQYKCAAMDTDRMVKYLLEELEAKNILDKTTILMYADHNCYYEDLYTVIKGVSKADFYDTYSYNIPCMIYSKKLGSAVNTTFVNTYDIYPTICELFGLPYNTAMTQGYDMFSPDIDKSVMVSYISGLFSKEIYSLNIVDMYTTENVTLEDMEFFKQNACRFYERQHDIELMYKYGLFLKNKDV